VTHIQSRKGYTNTKPVQQEKTSSLLSTFNYFQLIFKKKEKRKKKKEKRKKKKEKEKRCLLCR
jgi:hypothetical protein